MTGVWIAAIVAAKYLVPVLIVRFPFAAGWVNFVLDTVDGDLLIPLGLEDDTYQLIDKSADWATYVGMVLAARRWPIARTVVVLFALRTVGQLAFFVTRDEFVFFLFPVFFAVWGIGDANTRDVERLLEYGIYAFLFVESLLVLNLLGAGDPLTGDQLKFG